MEPSFSFVPLIALAVWHHGK